MHRPVNLLEAMDLAQQVEDRLEAVNRVRRNKVGRVTSPEYTGRPGLSPYSQINISETRESSLQSQSNRDSNGQQKGLTVATSKV